MKTDKSPIDDSKNVYLTLDSNDTIPALLGSSRPALVARCKGNNTNVYVVWGVYLGIDGTEVLVRLDGEKATQSTWSISTDYQATFYGGGDVEFLKSLPLWVRPNTLPALSNSSTQTKKIPLLSLTSQN